MTIISRPRTTTFPIVRRSREARNSHPPEIIVAALVLVAFVVMSFLAPVLTGYSPDAFTGGALEPPSPAHWFGTDILGRDVLVRTFAAVHVDYLVAAIGVVLSLLIGTALGLLVGAARHPFWGAALMRITDTLIAVPFPLLILVIIMVVDGRLSVFGTPAGVVQILVALLIAGWAIYARLARAETLGLKSREYVVAAELMGYSRLRILSRHILPRVLSVTATYAVADAVVIVGFVAGLPFLGAGVPPPTPEWGQMMYEGRSSMVIAWWQVTFPALALTVSAVAMSIIGDGLVDRSDRTLGRRP